MSLLDRTSDYAEPERSFPDAISDLQELAATLTPIIHGLYEAEGQDELRRSLVQVRARVRMAAELAADHMWIQLSRVQDRLGSLKTAGDILVAGLERIESDALVDGFAPHGSFVYLLTGLHRKVLYVGRSENILARLGTHVSDPSRGYKVLRVHLIRCKDRTQATHLEGRLIRKHRPPWNTIGVPLLPPVDPPAGEEQVIALDRNIDEHAAY